jgi:hypothetical protein
LINIDKKSIDTDGIVQGAKKLQQFYETDIDKNTFTQECIYFKTYMQNATEKNNKIKVYLHFLEIKIFYLIFFNFISLQSKTIMAQQ